jgi:hypothetical protein
MSDEPVIEYVTRVGFDAEAVAKLQTDRATLKAALVGAGIAIPLLVSE